MAASIITAFLPVPVFYLIYYRHFFAYSREEGHVSVYSKHLEAFLSGVLLALVVILVSPYTDQIAGANSVVTRSFIKAALVEKLGALAVILFIQRHYPRYNLLEAVMSGILVGAGFSLVENIFYSLMYGESIVIVRLFFSVTLHITTCGLIGYFSGIARLASTKLLKVSSIIRAAVLAVVLHGSFDYCLMKGGSLTWLIGPIVLFLVALVEFYIARAKLVPARAALAQQKLRLEEWFIKYRQPRYERWIVNSMGTPDTLHVPFLKARRGSLRWITAIILTIAGLLMFPFAHQITAFFNLTLSPQEQTLLVSVYPVSISFTLLIVGSINPLFFSYNVVKIPVIFDVVLFSNALEENLVTFDLSSSGCFLRTFEPIPEGTATMVFEGRDFKSPRVAIETIWENHQQKQKNNPTGSIVRIIDPPASFYLFLLRYHMFRLWKGIVFNLRLPGFQAVRLLFMRPVTVMLTEVVYKAGSTVFRQGDSIDTFYYVKKGKVRFYKELESGERIVIETMEEGQIFNEMVLLGTTQRNVTVECQTLCVLAQSKASNLDALIRNNPDFASALVRKLATRADQTQNNLTQTIDYLQKIIQIKDSRTRDATVLLALAAGNAIQDSRIDVEIDTTNIEKQTGLNSDEIIRFIHHSLTPGEIEHNTVSLKTSNKIEKFCRNIIIDLAQKK